MKPSAFGVGASPGAKTKPNPAIKAAARAKARPKPQGAAPPNRARAVQRYTGMMAAPLNELSSAEQRVRDVGARRQADQTQYHAFVLGQQGKLAAASAQQDQSAIKNTVGIQLAAAGANAKAQQGLQSAREAQGISGKVPSQQLGGLVDDQQRSNLMLAAVSQRGADQANTNAGKAGFLQAAAGAQLSANQRAIAGDEFNQTSAIRREKVGLLGQKEQMIQQQRQAAAAAAADIAEAQIRAQEQSADRASREGIANANISSREAVANANISLRQRLNESDNAFRAREGRANRRTRLRTGSQSAGGRVSPAQQAGRLKTVRGVEAQRESAVSMAKSYARSPKIRALGSAGLRAAIASDPSLKGAPREVIDYAMAAALGRRAGVTKRGQKSAARRYHDYVRAIKSGKA